MHDKDKNAELEVLNYLSKGDKFVFYVFKKISKISYAVYVVTDLIKDTEPLKWTLRKSATEIVALSNFFDEKSVFNTLEKSLLELEGFLDLASFAKVVSEMNSALLRREIGKLIIDMRERSKDGFGGAQLVGEFFDIPKPEVFTIAPVAPKPEAIDYSKGHKRQDVRYDFYKPENRTFSKPAPRVEEERSEVKKVTPENKGQRRDQILAIIKSKQGNPVSIKDITDRIKDCSEKTIQRELIAMVADNTLKKTGERRWSMYSIR